MVLRFTPKCPGAVLLCGRSGPHLHVANAQCAVVGGHVRCWPTHHFSSHIARPVSRTSGGPAIGVQELKHFHEIIPGDEKPGQGRLSSTKYEEHGDDL